MDIRSTRAGYRLMHRAGEQFDLVCDNGTRLGSFVDGQNKIAALRGESPAGVFYCPSSKKLYNLDMDSDELKSACAQPMENVLETYVDKTPRRSFPLCNGGYLKKESTTFFD